MVTVFKDKKNAVTANACYRATLKAIENAEAVDAFEFIPEPEVFEFEHWPLERRKIDEEIERERKTLLLARHVVIVIGGGSGIGEAAAHAYVEEGAHVVVADLDAAAAERVAAAVVGEGAGPRDRGRRWTCGTTRACTCCSRGRCASSAGSTACSTPPGCAPRFASLTELTREDLQKQLDVHYLGAVMAIAGAAAIMRRQGLGGSIVASVSKAALVPGKDAAAYGGSKAAMLQAIRVAAVELGGDGIRVNAINADQVETPLFLKFVAERAAGKGISVGGAAGGLQEAEPDGRVTDPGECGGGPGGAAVERAVQVHHRGHSHGGWRVAGGFSAVVWAVRQHARVSRRS